MEPLCLTRFKIRIISYVFFLPIFILFSACDGSGGNDKKSNDSGNSNPIVEDPTMEDPAEEDPTMEDPEDPAEEDPTSENLDIYIDVPANTALSVPDFRVMKYEAKNDGSGNPVSTEGTTPWVNISQIEAFAACRTLNSEGNNNDINSDTNEDGTYLNPARKPS